MPNSTRPSAPSTSRLKPVRCALPLIRIQDEAVPALIRSSISKCSWSVSSEDIASERGIAERCSDSISIRAFLGYDLTQTTPDHSTLSIIRQRLGEEIYDEVFLVILSALDKHGLLKGKNVGIDASVIQANAALKSLINRNTEEAYWEYVRRLASENGIDPKNAEAVRQFDRKRPKKMRNEEWVNPHDPDAKIGPTKGWGHRYDLQTGAHRGLGYRRDFAGGGPFGS